MAAAERLAPVTAEASAPPQNLDAEEVGARRDSRFRDRDGRSRRDPRPCDFYKHSMEDLQSRNRAVHKGEPVDAITLTDELGGAQRARGRRGPGPPARAGRARARDRERRALRADRARDGDAARAHPRGRRDRPPRLGPTRRDRRSRRPGRADRLRPLAAAGHGRVHAHRRPAEGELRADHVALRGRRRRHRHAVRLPRPRPADVRLPAGQPDHHRRAPVDGEVGARALHGREHRRAPEHPGRRCSRSRCRRPR